MSVRSTIARSAVTAAFVATCSIANGGIDLTPSTEEYISEGMKYQRAIFRADKQRIEYVPPARWTFTGNPASLRLTPPKKPFAEAFVEASQLSAPRPLDDSAIEALKRRFIASVPSGSQFVTTIAEETNPLLLDGAPTFEVIVSYATMGQKFVRSALFANVGDTQLTFRLTARKDDFDALHRELRASLLSWHAIELKTDTADVAAVTTK